ncbi:MAG: right-handed parallel beta-helix repeat-containing protein [Deltaproteobacteria bacterium]|nr:MAG: right-handed parallel beta-helix repeat-containing protein [Deltaproteobacteria bacterium]
MSVRRLKVALFFILPILLLMGSQDSFAGKTEVSGTIYGDTVWTEDKSPYIVTDNLIVSEEITLKIKPGVTVEIEPDKEILVDGILVAVGNKKKPIRFTRRGEENWSSINFTHLSKPATFNKKGKYQDGSTLQYCTIEYGKGIKVRLSSLFVEHCIIRNNEDSGIRIEYGGGQLKYNKITNNRTRGNGGGVIVYTDKTVLISNNIVSNNGSREGDEGGGGIYAYSYAGGLITIEDNVVSKNWTDSKGGGIYAYSSIVKGNLVIGNEAADAGGGIWAYGGEATGNRVVANKGSRGGGLYGEKAKLTRNAVAGNESTSPEGGGIYFWGSKDFSYNTITRNSAPEGGSGGVYVSGNPVFNYNHLYGNSGYDFYCGNPQDFSPVDARYCYWGSVNEGDIMGVIYDWYDDRERGLVDYQDYLNYWGSAPPLSSPSGLVATGHQKGIELTWETNPEPDIKGYRVYYGKEPFPYPEVKDVGKSTDFSLKKPTEGDTYYFAVTAYRKKKGDREESAFSRELSMKFFRITNEPPAAPRITSPSPGQKEVGLAPALEASGFSDPEGNSHRASQWQITSTPGNYSSPVYDSGSDDKHLTGIKVPPGNLNHGITYYWRVRYQDGKGGWSQWSESSFSTLAQAPGVLRGPISRDTVLSTELSPCLVNGNLRLMPGITCRIEPGVTLKLAPRVDVRIEGVLVADGKDSTPVTFTRSGEEKWGALKFSEFSKGAELDEEGNYRGGSILRYCVVEEGEGVRIKQSAPLITHSTIKNNSNSGITLEDGGARIVNNLITKNSVTGAGGGIYASSNKLVVIRDNTITHNRAKGDDGNGGGIYANSYGGGEAFVIEGNKVSSNWAVKYGGGIYAQRSEVTGNTFTGNVALVGGGGIYATFSIITGNEVKGNKGGEGGGIYVERNSSAKENKIIKNEATSARGGGLYLNYWGFSLGYEEVTRNVITDNSASTGKASGGVYVVGNPDFNYNNISGNRGFALYCGNPEDSEPVNAKDCYWGTPDKSAVGKKIYDGRLDKRKGRVEFIPFLKNPSP